MLQSVFCLGVVVTNLHDRVHADVVSHSTTDRALRAKPLLDVVCAPKGGGKGGEMERDKGARFMDGSKAYSGSRSWCT